MKYQAFNKLLIIKLFFLFSVSLSYAQVGINTTTPSDGSILDIESSDKGVFTPKVDILDLSTIAPITGVGATVAELLAAEGLLVYNTNTTTGPGFFYWTGSQWSNIAPSVAEPPIDSVTLEDNFLTNSTTFVNVPDMSLTFTARKTSVLVQLSGSGIAATNSMALVQFRVNNQTTGTIVGGTNTNMQNFEQSVGTTTAWSCSFSRLLTGLTVGDTYTLVPQVQVIGVFNNFNAAIFPDFFPDSNHLTLSVIH